MAKKIASKWTSFRDFHTDLDDLTCSVVGKMKSSSQLRLGREGVGVDNATTYHTQTRVLCGSSHGD